ncbi:hypothetical protein AVEN_238819-1 [Araneus ventricosus]|uniref:Uncharacterized protein n=1 Tax=Araneus ventricosus TaxID=182803 RepID=A0A4Y2QSV0_ARAVE|nr:hypothetical protein AVEN_238819-1 [Araneus ventricosus]
MMSRAFGIVPISQCLLPKSELIWDFKSELITQLFSALRSLKTKFETPKSVFHRTSLSPLNIPFLSPTSRGGAPPSFHSTGHWIIVLPGDQRQTMFPVVKSDRGEGS